MPYKNGSWRNPIKTGPKSSGSLTPESGAFDANNSAAKAAEKGSSDAWMKAGTIFGGLDLALTPLWFIPMGGDEGRDGSAGAGAAAQDPTSSISSSSSSSSSLLMLMVLIVLILVAAS